jgi:hypothetical protein
VTAPDFFAMTTMGLGALLAVWRFSRPSDD